MEYSKDASELFESVAPIRLTPLLFSRNSTVNASLLVLPSIVMLKVAVGSVGASGSGEQERTSKEANRDT